MCYVLEAKKWSDLVLPNIVILFSIFAASLPTSRLSNMASPVGLQSPASSAHLSRQAQTMESRGFEFDVSDFFMLGSPVPLVLANRVIRDGPGNISEQVLSLFIASSVSDKWPPLV